MRYLILGTTEALGPDGSPLPLGGARLRALLAALALRGGRAATVAELVEDVYGGGYADGYGDEPPQDAPAALQALVGRLRRALGREAVASTPGPGYRLTARPDDIDLYAFQRLAREAGARLDADDPEAAAALFRQALALFRGPALADLPEPAGVRPEAQRLAALRGRVEADLRRGAPGLVPELSELTTTHPYDETFHAQLLRALRAEGRHADALAAYETARRTLAAGLGTDPGPELTALHRTLLTRPPRHRSEAPPAGPGAEPTGNIRPRLTSFVGREPDLVAVRQDLGRSRLVTLTGPGGSGKTRLAEEAARRGGTTGPASATGPASSTGPDTATGTGPGTASFTGTGSGPGGGPPVGAPPAWIVELAPLDDPDAVPGAVLSALRLREINLIARDGVPHQADPTAHLVEQLARRGPFLLVLDNCEHVIDAAAALAETLLTHCPELRVLATSREPLGVPGESVRPVEPLPPDPAHRLFAERARAVRPDFDPAQDAGAVEEICRRLDGLPLAIELAAARLRLLTPRQIADRLDDRFLLLTSGARTVLPRQQTLRAVVDWSWDLLEPAERDLLRRLSVFAGGWDLPAAEALAPDAADVLGALVDKSLVVAAPADGGGMRYRLLETIHEYAVERAAETPGLLAAAEAAHTAHFTALAEEAEPRLRSAEQLPWIDRIERDLDNIRAALHRTVLTAPDERAALRLVFAMGWFWWLRNYRPEGLVWTERAVALGDDPDDPADPRHWPRMHLRMLQFFLAVESRSVAEFRDDPETAALVRRLRAVFGDEPGPESARFPGLLWPFTSYVIDGAATIRGTLDAAVANCRRHGGDWEVGVSLMFRTHMVIDMPGGTLDVDEDLAELRDLFHRAGDRWMGAQIASAAGEAHMLRGRHDEAGRAYEEALALAREVGAHAETPFLIARLAELAYRAGDAEAAEKGLDEAAREADRYHVIGTHAYVCLLRAALALDRGDVRGARAELEAAGATVDEGTPPPHFQAVLTGFAARVEAAEGAGLAAVATAAAALRLARDAQCADFITVGMTEGLAVTLAAADEHALAIRVLSAAAALRRNSAPRSVPEAREIERLTAGAVAALGAAAVARARTAGAGLDLDDVLALTDALPDAPAGADASGLRRS
ncbi:ATP-binding protein [Streptomyces sp. NPDC003327]